MFTIVAPAWLCSVNEELKPAEQGFLAGEPGDPQAAAGTPVPSLLLSAPDAQPGSLATLLVTS